MADWLKKNVFDSYFGTRDIWGRDRSPLADDTPQPRNTAPAPAGRALAYAFAWQLHSRITTQRLGFRVGDEVTALDSVYELFDFARQRVEAAGPAASQTADMIWWLLNRDVRPFTARWHRTKVKGLLAVEDVARRFRGELETLRAALVDWAGLLRNVASGEGSETANLPGLEIPAAVDDAINARTEPCQFDGMAAPFPNDQAFADMVKAEKDLLERWRKETGRGDDQLCGIALSGGGIRSAAFGLGVLRELALNIDVFGIDYLSTVSGGGYLGTMITMAFEDGILTEQPMRGPLGRGKQRDLGAEVIAWVRSRGRVMQADKAFIGSLAGGVFGLGDVGLEYRERLREGWILKQKDRVPGLGRMIVGQQDGKAPGIGELKKNAPLQLWNMALNATNPSPELEVALRGRACDLYTVSRAGAESRLLGYSRSNTMEVDAAMAISAAACAPTTDEDTSSWVLRVAGLAGANLGRWVDHETGKDRAAGWWDRVKGLVGKSGAERGSAFLSDGGHIENLALYQLLRRRCACILAIDGEEDPKMTFSSLMKLQHLVRVEQSITLDIDVRALCLGPEGLSDAHFAVIPIYYPALHAPDGKPVAEAQRGILVYAKLSLTGDEPQYLRAYKADHPEFPHHSTLKQQSFDDRMFEAYLALGEHVGAQLVSETWCGEKVKTKFSEWISQLAKRFADA